RQFTVQFDEAFALSDPAGRWVLPAWVLGAEFMTTADVPEGLGELSVVPEYEAQVAVGLGIVLFEVDGLPVRSDGLIHFPLGAQVVAEAVMGLREVLPEADRLPVLRDGLVQAPLLCQQEAEVVMGLGAIVLLEADPLPVLRDGLVHAVLFAEDI